MSRLKAAPVKVTLREASLPRNVNLNDLKVVKVIEAGKARNGNPRGNPRDYFLPAILTGVNLNIINFLNPNKEGRGGVIPYITDKTLGVKLHVVEYNGQSYLLLPEGEDRDYFLSFAAKFKLNGRGVISRALKDYTEKFDLK